MGGGSTITVFGARRIGGERRNGAVVARIIGDGEMMANDADIETNKSNSTPPFGWKMFGEYL